MKAILSDHKRKKKRLVPPLMEIGNLQEVSYISKIVPETIWMAILVQKHGLQLGTQLGLDLVKAASDVNSQVPIFSFISSFELLSSEEKMTIRKKLASDGVLIKLQNALTNFVAIYPDCPLAFLFDSIEQNYNLEEMKDLLVNLFDIKSSEATFMLGSVLYHMGALGRLRIVKDSALTKLPELKDYPKTPVSQMIASMVRASMYAMMNDTFHNSKGEWNKLFWAKGIELEPCKIGDE
jgi:hypothetical protein